MEEISTLKTLDIPLKDYNKLNSTQLELAKFLDDLGVFVLQNMDNKRTFLKVGALGSRLLNLLISDLNITDDNMTKMVSKIEEPIQPVSPIIQSIKMPPLEAQTIYTPIVDNNDDEDNQYSSILSQIDNLEF